MGLVSTTLVGMQTVLSNAVTTLSLSHLELKKRFDSLYATSNKNKEFPMEINEPNSEEQPPMKLGNSKTVEEETLKLLWKTLALLNHQERVIAKFSPLLLVIVSFYLICITLFCYSSVSVLVAKMNILMFSSALSHGLLFVYYLFTFGVISFLGQALMDQQKETADALARVYYQNRLSWTEATRDYAELVKEKVQKTIGLSPYSFFTLDRSGFLSTLALVFTYLILLLQFKTSE